jgi:N-acetyl-anhydromuramyl-L-alanine amidase AmpD
MALAQRVVRERLAPARLLAEPRTIRRWQSSNRWSGRPYGPPIAMVLHTTSGGESVTVGELMTGAAALSAHYRVGLHGELDCFVELGDRAWGNGVLETGNAWEKIARACNVDPRLDPNHITVICETEDGGSSSSYVTDTQFEAVVYAVTEARRRFPDSLRYLMAHADIAPESRAACPGMRWMASGRFRVLARRAGLEILR